MNDDERQHLLELFEKAGFHTNLTAIGGHPVGLSVNAMNI